MYTECPVKYRPRTLVYRGRNRFDRTDESFRDFCNDERIVEALTALGETCDSDLRSGLISIELFYDCKDRETVPRFIGSFYLALVSGALPNALYIHIYLFL